MKKVRRLRNRLENSRSIPGALVQIHSILCLLVLTPLGFATKLYHGPAGLWVNNSFGGMFYEIFWCLVAAFASSCARSWIIAVWFCCNRYFGSAPALASSGSSSDTSNIYRLVTYRHDNHVVGLFLLMASGAVSDGQYWKS